MGEEVKSLFSEITLKYGKVIELPKTLESFKKGFKKPDCLFTVSQDEKI